MKDRVSTRKKKRFDPKSPCPHCGERIGFVEPRCPFCSNSLPYWSDSSGKILLSLGILLMSGYLLALYLSWGNEGATTLLAGMARVFVAVGFACEGLKRSVS